jgi:hypothetical protein
VLKLSLRPLTRPYTGIIFPKAMVKTILPMIKVAIEEYSVAVKNGEGEKDFSIIVISLVVVYFFNFSDFCNFLHLKIL